MDEGPPQVVVEAAQPQGQEIPSPQAPRKRGRPLGSKNRVRLDSAGNPIPRTWSKHRRRVWEKQLEKKAKEAERAARKAEREEKKEEKEFRPLELEPVEILEMHTAESPEKRQHDGRTAQAEKDWLEESRPLSTPEKIRTPGVFKKEVAPDLDTRDGVIAKLKEIIKEPATRDQDRLRAIGQLAELQGYVRNLDLSNIKRLSNIELLEKANQALDFLESLGVRKVIR